MRHGIAKTAEEHLNEQSKKGDFGRLAAYPLCLKP